MGLLSLCFLYCLSGCQIENESDGKDLAEYEIYGRYLAGDREFKTDVRILPGAVNKKEEGKSERLSYILKLNGSNITPSEDPYTFSRSYQGITPEKFVYEIETPDNENFEIDLVLPAVELASYPPTFYRDRGGKIRYSVADTLQNSKIIIFMTDRDRRTASEEIVPLPIDQTGDLTGEPFASLHRGYGTIYLVRKLEQMIQLEGKTIRLNLEYYTQEKAIRIED